MDKTNQSQPKPPAVPGTKDGFWNEVQVNGEETTQLPQSTST